MSGICATWLRGQSNRTVAETVEALNAGLRLDKSERPGAAVREEAAVGVSARFAGQQVFESPRLLVACDAELYNEKELWAEIGGAAEERGPAALLAGLYERFGTGFAVKLRGAFCCVIWDALEKTLIAATDGFAIYPPVYAQTPGGFLVASRIEALLETGRVSRDIFPGAIANYFNYTVNLAPDTVFKEVKRMLPGTLLVVTASGVRTERYWDMRYGIPGISGEQALERHFCEVLDESVRAHCKQDDFATIGAFLSGGTDSSSVIGLMSRMGRGTVRSYSIGFDDDRFNELEYARIAARAFHSDHHEYLVTAADCVEAIPDMVRHFDEPFGNSSSIPTYFCARLAAQTGVRTLLAGDGGDELFGGNERYATDKIFQAYQQVPSWLRKGLIEPALKLPVRIGAFEKARSYTSRSNLAPHHRYFSYNVLVANPPGMIFEPEFVERLNGYSVLTRPEEYYRTAPAKTHLDRLLYIDMKMTLADNDLLKVTRMAEMAGVRARFPFLDKAVAEMSGRIPAHLKVKGFKKRYLFKRALRDLLPPEIISKKKHGFGIPVAVWMKSDRRMRELTNDVLRSNRTYERGVFRRSFVEELFHKHEHEDTVFYGDWLWTFLALEMWFRQFVDVQRSVAA